MADNSMQRKLRAIFSADVKGYSKLMGDDDESTVITIFVNPFEAAVRAANITEFGRQDHLVASIFDGAAHKRLIMAHVIHIGRIEKIDHLIQGLMSHM